MEFEDAKETSRLQNDLSKTLKDRGSKLHDVDLIDHSDNKIGP